MRKFIRYTLGRLLWPLIFLMGNLYKQYQKVANKKAIKLKYNDIVDGFSYLIMTDPKVEQAAKKRASICSTCPQASYIGKHKSTVLVNDKQHTYKSMKCKVCGCALAAKVRAMNDSCPIGLWQNENTTN